MTRRARASIPAAALAAAAFLATAVPALASEGGEGSNLFAGDLGNAIWTLVIFLAVVFVLGRWAWGPILERLQAREDFIRKSLTEAKADREAAEARLQEYEERLAAARAEATAIVDEGRRDAGAVRQRIEEEGREEAGKMLERARREIEIAKQTAIKDIYSVAARLATAAASKIIAKELTPEDHERLVAESIAELEGMGPRQAN